jgi:hypothetical protein
MQGSVMRSYWYIPAAGLLVLLVVCFFAGWLQLALGPDVWGVAFTRSRGFEENPVSPAGFTWRWQRLVPRCLTLYRIPLKTEKAELDVTAALPSADAYASLVPEKPDFSLEVKLSILYRIRPEALPALVGASGLRPENLGDWHAQLRAELERKVTEIALASGGSRDAASFASSLAARIPGEFPQLQFVSISPAVIRMPDPVLYARLRDAYLRVVAQKEAALAAMAPRLASEEAAQRLSAQAHETSIAVLTKYGELLTRYPSLIKFLFLATAGQLTAKDMQTLDLLEKLPTLE